MLRVSQRSIEPIEGSFSFVSPEAIGIIIDLFSDETTVMHMHCVSQGIF
jgi:hypothetical protein